MTDKERVVKFLAEHNGVIRTQDVRRLGMDTKVLQRLAADGQIERLTHGLYMDANHFEDPFNVAQYRCPNCIFSMDTALFLHQLTDRNPDMICVTIPSGFNTPLLAQPMQYRLFYLKHELWQMGQTNILSPYGNSIIVYDMERTICDCIRKIDELDRHEVISAVVSYMKRPMINLQALLDYAEIFKVRDTVRQYMEVLR